MYKIFEIEIFEIKIFGIEIFEIEIFEMKIFGIEIFEIKIFGLSPVYSSPTIISGPRVMNSRESPSTNYFYFNYEIQIFKKYQF